MRKDPPWRTVTAGACPFCGSDSSERVVEHDGLRAVICTSCCAVYLAEQPDVEDYRRFYASEYRSSFHPATPEELYALQVVKSGRAVGFSMPFLSRRPQFGVLDVGASAGGTLRGFAAAGATRCVGVDISPPEAEYARSLGYDVYTGTLDALDGEGGGFDLAILSGTIDHLDDPAGDITRIRSLLRADGFLYVSISDVVELARWRPNPLNPEHLTYYSSATLRSLISRLGFLPVAWRADTAAESARRHHDVLHASGPWLTIEGLFQVSNDDAMVAERLDWRSLRDAIQQAFLEHRRPWRRRARKITRALR